MLVLKNVNKNYYIKDKSQFSLKKININFENSGFVAILGRSGSGKSTLLNLIGGLDRYDDGEICINGKSTKDFTNNEWDAYRNTYIGFIFQEFYMIDRFKVGENIALALILQGYKEKEIIKRTKEILNIVGLEDHYDRKISDISGGEKQRVAIARALVKDPEIILADEPTGNLDDETSKVILDILKRLSKDKLVIMVTHDKEFAKEYGDRIIELKDGEVSRDTINHNNNNCNKLVSFNLKKSCLPFRNVVKYSLNNLLVKKTRLIFMLILFIMSLVFVSISTSLTFYNVGDAMIKTFDRAKLTSLPLIKYNNNNISFTDADISNYQIQYPDINFVKSISGNYIVLPVSSDSVEDANYFNKITIINTQNELLFPLQYGNYPQKTGDILITDYMAKMIIKANLVSNADSEQGLIGDFLTNKDGINLKITGIVKTKYDENMSKDANFMLIRNEYYQQLFMTEETYSNLFLSGIIEVQNSGFINDVKTYLVTNMFNSELIGSLPTQDNEIVIRLSDLSNYFSGWIDTQNITKTEIENYLNKTITLDLSYYGQGEKKFTVVGIIDNRTIDVNFTYMLDKNMFYYYTYNAKDSSKVILTAYLGKDTSENHMFIHNLQQNNNIKFDTIYSNQLYGLQSYVRSTRNVSYIIGAVFAIFASIMIATFISISIKDKQKEIGTLRALGARGIDILKIFGLESFLIIFITDLFAFLGTYFVLKWQNNMITDSLNLNIVLLYLNYFSIITTLLFSIFLTAISTVIPLSRITKMLPIKTIKRAE